MKKDKVKTFFKGNFTTEIIDAMAPIWDKCIDDAGTVNFVPENFLSSYLKY